MNVTCKSILNLPYANQLKPIAGEEGMDNVISWVYYMEDIHYVEWLKGGELVLITGLVTKEREQMLLELIDALYEKEVAGVIINLSFYIKSIPQEVIDRGNFLGLPIFEMPAMLRIVDVSQSICFAIFKEETAQYDVSVTLFGILSGNRLTAKRLSRLEAAGYLQKGKYRAVLIKLKEADVAACQNGERAIEETWEKEFRHLGNLIRTYMPQDTCLTTTDEDSYIWMKPVSEEHNIQDEAKHFADFLHQKSPKMEYSIGIGNVFSDLRQFKSSVESAQEAIRIGCAQQKEKQLYIYDDMILLRLFERFEDKEKLMQIAAQILKELLLPENEELLKTLFRFVSSGFMAKAAAKKLFIHENTMHYRLKKITSMLGVDFKNYHDLFQLTLAVEIVNFCTDADKANNEM